MEFLLEQALSEDEKGNIEAALPLYTDVIELCLERVRSLVELTVKMLIFVVFSLKPTFAMKCL